MKTLLFIFLAGIATAMAGKVGQRKPEELPEFMKDFMNSNPRIINGQVESDRTRAPWVGSMADYYYGPGHFCGFTILSPYWVLCAGHCVYPGYEQDYILRAGFTYYNTSDPNAQIRTVARIVRHPNYNSNTLANDICLLKLSQPWNFTQYVKNVILDKGTANMPPGTLTSVLGWGVTDENAYDTSPNLMKVTVPLVDDNVCRANYSSIATVNPCGMCCAGGDDKDACYGDSGGPLMLVDSNGVTPYQYGIVSWGYGCARPGYPGVYTRTSKYIDWMDACMANPDSAQCQSPGTWGRC